MYVLCRAQSLAQVSTAPLYLQGPSKAYSVGELVCCLTSMDELQLGTLFFRDSRQSFTSLHGSSTGFNNSTEQQEEFNTGLTQQPLQGCSFAGNRLHCSYTIRTQSKFRDLYPGLIPHPNPAYQKENYFQQHRISLKYSNPNRKR